MLSFIQANPVTYDEYSLPQNYMFGQMRSALSIPKTTDILEHVRSLPASEQPAANQKLRDIESSAMQEQQPQPGLSKLMTYLTSKSIPKALCTRNFAGPVDHLCQNFIPDEEFIEVVTRETEGVRPKPSPEGIWKCAQAILERRAESISVTFDWRSQQDSTLKGSTGSLEEADPLELAKQHLGAGLVMVGDSIDDMQAGYRAGAATVLLLQEHNEHLSDHEFTDLTVKSLDELIPILENGFTGKERAQV